jgi:hypothetical protein
MALAGELGAEICLDDANPTETSFAAAHFGEDQGRYVVTTDGTVNLRELAETLGTTATMIGTTGFKSDDDEGILCEASDSFVPLADLREAHQRFFREWMED